MSNSHVDLATSHAQRLTVRTHVRSLAFPNVSITKVDVDGQSAFVVTLFVPKVGARVAQPKS